MVVSDVKRILNAEYIWGEELENTEIYSACGSDMMSDVLAFVKDQSVLITGLCNPQVIRTAEMMDIICVCFVRGKTPDEAMIDLAKERGITLMRTKMRMFTACGTLYEKGLGRSANKCV